MIPRLYLTEADLHARVLDAKTGDRQASDTVLRSVIALVQQETTYVYQKQRPGHRSDYDDLFQAACTGILQAIQNWDPDRRKPFVLYAKYFARGYARQLNKIPRPEPTETGEVEDTLETAEQYDRSLIEEQQLEEYRDRINLCIAKRRKPKHKHVLALRLQGRTQQQVANEMRMTKANVSLIEKAAWKELLPCIRHDLTEAQVDTLAKQLRKRGFK